MQPHPHPRMKYNIGQDKGTMCKRRGSMVVIILPLMEEKNIYITKIKNLVNLI